jgi:divalent metal cation (Fe/Co/Zn/Cd) transporter
MHKYGATTELTVHIRLKPDMDISRAHEITRSIEQLLKEKFSITATVHVEPAGEDEVDVELRSSVKH